MAITLEIKLVPIPGIPKPFLLEPLGLLSPLTGTWKGSGFNQIFRPFFGPGSDNFLELNLTNETLAITEIPRRNTQSRFSTSRYFSIWIDLSAAGARRECKRNRRSAGRYPYRAG